jgi:glycosyltransferase involved in cell wall biosynthesis
VDPLAQARAAGLAEGRVRVLGRVADADLAVLLNRATVVVVPSRAEGFGLAVLEAMFAGAAVVTSDDPALVEVGGGVPLVVPIGDSAALAVALSQLSSDSERRAAMIAGGRSRAATYTWAGAAKATWKLYRELA